MLLDGLSVATKIKLILLLIGIAGAFGAGWQVNAWRYQADISNMQKEALESSRKAEIDAREIEGLNINISNRVDENNALKARKQKIVTRTISHDVIKYIKSDTPKCDLSTKWVQLHDAAASGRVSEVSSAPSEPNAEATKVTDDQAIITVTENYGTCKEIVQQLESLQDWVKSVK